MLTKNQSKGWQGGNKGNRIKEPLTAESEPRGTESRAEEGETRRARQARPGATQHSPDPQQYLGQEVLAAADGVVEPLDQQRLHMLDDQPCSCVAPAALPLRLPGRLARGGRTRLRRAVVRALGSLCDLLARTRTGVSQADGFSFLLSVA